MRILIASHTFPYPPNEGIKLPLYCLIKEFTKDNKVSLISFISEEEKIFVEEIKKYCEELELIVFNPHKNFLKRGYNLFFEKVPYNVRQFFHLEFKEKLLNLVKKLNFDIIFFNFLTTVIYSNFIDKNKIKFLHYYDAMSMLFYRNFLVEKNLIKKIYWYNQYKKLLNYEFKLQNWFNKIAVVSQKDKDWLCENAKISRQKLEVIPNGVDIEYFYYKFNKNFKEEQLSLLFRGIMNFKPNVDACLYFLKEIYPLIKKEIPNIKIYIVGPNPSYDILEYAKKEKNIIVTGYVEDIREYILKCKINVCPMISGSGIKNKILESLAMGTPSVITSIAKEGIPELEDGKNVLIADTPADFANKIKMLFENKDLYYKIAYNGRKLVEEKYTWNKVAQRFYQIFEELTKTYKTL